MKSKVKFAAAALVILAVLSGLVFKYCEEIADAKAHLKEKIRDLRNGDFAAGTDVIDEDTNIDFSGYPQLADHPDAWYHRQRVIMHACGGIDGLSYTNSREAMENTIAEGKTVIEVDFAYTADHQLACIHKWKDQWGDEVPTMDEFRAGTIYGKYTPLTAEDVVKYMAENPELYIVTDTKEEDFGAFLQDLTDLASEYSGVAERFIIQLYEEGQKETAKQIYPFDDAQFLFTAYDFIEEHGNFPNRIMNICYTEDINVVTVPQNKWEPETLELFRQKGIYVYEHTINRVDIVRGLEADGVYGIYTDFLFDYKMQ